MKKSLIVLATTAVLASSLISTSSVARGFSGQGGERPENIQKRQGNHQEGGQAERRGSHNPEQHLLRLTRILNLSDDQVVAITAIQDGQKESLEEIREDMKMAREALKILVQADTYNENEVATVAATIGQLVTELTIFKSKGKFDIYQVLTDEQKTQLEELLNFFSGHKGNPADDNREGSSAEDSETS